MTTYTKTTWTNEVPGSTPVKYKLTDDTLGVIANSAKIEVVTSLTAGTPVNAQNLNNMETGIENAHIEIAALVTDLAGTVAAQAYTTAAPSIPTGSSTIVNFATVTLGASYITTGSNWKFTAPVSGIYAIAARLMFTSTEAWDNIENAAIYINKNGSSAAEIARMYAHRISGVALTMAIQGVHLISLSASDYISVGAYQNTGAALQLSAISRMNEVNIWRIR